MQPRICLHILIAALCWIGMCGAAHAQPALTKADIDQLKHGKILLRETKPHYLKKYSNTPWVAMAYFRLTPVQMAGVILDFHQYTKIFPKVKDLEIYPLGDSRYRLKYTVKSGLFTFRYTVIMNYGPTYDAITWRLDPEYPGDFKQYKGYWKFIRQGSFTLGIYSISPLAKVPVPDFVQEQGARNEMPQTVREVKEWIRKMPKMMKEKTGKESPWPEEKKQESRLLKFGV